MEEELQHPLEASMEAQIIQSKEIGDETNALLEAMIAQ